MFHSKPINSYQVDLCTFCWLKEDIFVEKWKKKKKWELTVYVQVYLFIILYSYWIATNITQYLLYLVGIVYEYRSVFTQLYLRKWGQLLYQRNMQSFFRNTRTFHEGRGVLLYLCMVRRFHSDDPCFCDCRSDLVPIVWCNQIPLTPYFSRNNQFVSITFSSRDTWT